MSAQVLAHFDLLRKLPACDATSYMTPAIYNHVNWKMGLTSDFQKFNSTELQRSIHNWKKRLLLTLDVCKFGGQLETTTVLVQC